MKIIFFFLIPLIQLFPQTDNILLSQENIRLFAEYLFSQKDYLRAFNEFDKLYEFKTNDTIIYKSAFSLIKIDKFNEADLLLNKIPKGSKLNFFSRELQNKNSFLEGKTENFEKKESISQIRLSLYSSLYKNNLIENKENFISAFQNEIQSDIQKFYERKINPEYKSPLKAALLSAIFPGAGKIYAGELGDGIAAFVATTLSGYLAYTNFKENRSFRSWLFTGITLLYYAGNIYGAAASADIFNKKIDFQFKVDLDSFIRSNNYFIETPEFVK